MKKEKTLSILLLALILIAGGIAYIVYPHSESSTDIILPRNDNPGMTASSTTESTVPSETLKKESASYLGRDGVYVVKYTDTGFVPTKLQIPKGKSVRFINMSSKAMQVFSDDLVTPKFVELNESKAVGKGSTYTFSFTITGLWQYHNEINKAHKANILVY